VIRARQGDTTAFERLAMRHMTDLYRMATAMVGAADARDVTQEALIAAWRELPRLRDPDRFVPWLRRILLNRCRNQLRSRSRRPTQNLLEDAPGHGSDLADADRRMAVEDALVGLPMAQRAVIVLHYLVGLPLREVAETLAIPEGTVKSRLNAALVALRGQLEEVPP
jgi:RNA polymerase sigma factor (sigma-70 family)